MKLLKIVFSSLLFTQLLIFGCAEERSNPVDLGVHPSITNVNITQFWNTLSDELYKVEVSINDPQGPGNIAAVYLTVVDQSSGNEIFSDSLRDDGAIYFPEDGDVFANDGVYSYQYRPADIVTGEEQKNCLFYLLAIDEQNHQSAPLEYPVFFGPNHRPNITQISTPDTLSVETTDVIFAIKVSDSDGLDDIQTAYFESKKAYKKFEKSLYNDGDFVNHGDLVAGDSVFSTRVYSDFIIGKQGDYQLIFHATDTFNESNADQAIKNVFIGNLPSSFIDIVVPASMFIPGTPETYNRELMTVEVSDPEGLADIDSVYFFSRKPDSTFANNGLPFLMVDNGFPFNINNYLVETGDLSASDGIYSFSLVIFSDYNPGEYTFTFYMRDFAGNLTGPVERKINIIGN